MKAIKNLTNKKAKEILLHLLDKHFYLSEEKYLMWNYVEDCTLAEVEDNKEIANILLRLKIELKQ